MHTEVYHRVKKKPVHKTINLDCTSDYSFSRTNSMISYARACVASVVE